MATDAGELIVKISGDVSDIKDAMAAVTRDVSKLGAGTVASGVVMADAFKMVARAVFDFAKDSILQFGEQEQAMLRLSAAVGSSAAGSFEKLADQISKTTTFTDNEVIALEAQLTLFGLNNEQVRKATTTMVDFAARMGVTLPEAASTMGQALAGNGRQLKQLGVEILQTDTRTERFDKTITAINGNMGGFAAKLRDTTLGQVTALKNSFEQVEQQVGRLLSGSNAVKNLTASFDALSDRLKQFNSLGAVLKAGVLDILTTGFLQLVNAIKPYIALWNQTVTSMGNVGKVMGLVKINIDGVTGGIAKQILQWRKSADVSNDAAKVTKTTEAGKRVAIDDTTRAVDAYISALQHSILVATAVNSKITEITSLETKKRLAEMKNSYEANASFSDQLQVRMADNLSKSTTAFVDMTSSMVDGFATSTAKMIVEGGKFSDVLKNLWQSIAEAVIAQIIRMIAEYLIWLAVTGGTGSFAGGFIGRGASGGMINEPSMIIGLRSGTSILAGEAGPEQFGPVGTTNSLNSGGGGAPSGGSGGGGGGGDVHVHISGQFVEGNPTKWQRLIQEQIAPEIRRLAMKDPNSLITRKRGSLR